jgi:hypothetical protein
VNRGSDPDDWFGGVAEDDGVPDAEYAEDWLQEAEQRSPPWYETIDRRVVVAAVVAVAALIAILAAAGVFSGGSHPRASVPPPTTVAPPATTPATTPPAKPAVAAPTATLKPGDTGTQVKVLQRALAALGFSTGKPDGDYGPATEAAVKRFQGSAGLKADGVVGPATLRALTAALRSR